MKPLKKKKDVHKSSGQMDNTALPKTLGGSTFWFPQTSRYILTVLKRRSKLIDTQSKIKRSIKKNENE